MSVSAIRYYCEIHNHKHDSFRGHGYHIDSTSKSLALVIRDNVPLLSRPEAERKNGLDLDVKQDVALQGTLTYDMLRSPVGDETGIAYEDYPSSFNSFPHVAVQL
jgi:hypothetical protein